jgi:hypothetical protein
LAYIFAMQATIQKKRVVLVHWKNKPENPNEVFSSLKNFCLSYHDYNYNTLNNYLSKGKIPFDNQDIHIERKNVILKPKPELRPAQRRTIVPVVRKVLIHQAEDEKNDFVFWMSKTPLDRLAAVSGIVSSSLSKSTKLDKSKIAKRKLKS